MSKPIKEMIVEQYKQRFDGVEGAVVVDLRGLDGNENSSFRDTLRKEQVRVTVVKNTLARKAFGDTPLEALGPALEGPAALAYGAESVVEVARSIVEWAKTTKGLQLKAAILDGQLFEGADGVKRLSQFPTREEAQAKVVSLVLAPAGTVLAGAKGPGGRVLGVIKEIQERLEKGEPIAKVG